MIQTVEHLVQILRCMQFDFHVRTMQISYEEPVYALVIYGNVCQSKELDALWDLLHWRLQPFRNDTRIFIPVSEFFDISEV